MMCCCPFHALPQQSYVFDGVCRSCLATSWLYGRAYKREWYLNAGYDGCPASSWQICCQREQAKLEAEHIEQEAAKWAKRF